MTTIRDGIEWGKTQIGKPYDSTWANRFGPNAYDCSGLVSQVLWHAGMPQGALPTNSADMARWLLRPENAHYRLTRAQAISTYGAVCVMGGTSGYGPLGHVEVSLGNGSNLGSTGGHGVDIKPFARIVWSDYFLAPQVDYGVPPAPPVPHPTLMEDTEMMLMRGDKTPEVWLVNGPWKTHVTAEAYPGWLWTLASRTGAIDPTTRKVWVVPQVMVDIIPNTASVATK